MTAHRATPDDSLLAPAHHAGGTRSPSCSYPARCSRPCTTSRSSSAIRQWPASRAWRRATGRRPRCRRESPGAARRGALPLGKREHVGRLVLAAQRLLRARIACPPTSRRHVRPEAAGVPARIHEGADADRADVRRALRSTISTSAAGRFLRRIISASAAPSLPDAALAGSRPARHGAHRPG